VEVLLNGQQLTVEPCEISLTVDATLCNVIICGNALRVDIKLEILPVN
jgi:hypothetical protein